METLLSLTSKRAGDWFKEELRLLGGLDHIVDKGILEILLLQCAKNSKSKMFDFLNINFLCSRIEKMIHSQFLKMQFYDKLLGNISDKSLCEIESTLKYFEVLQSNASLRYVDLFAVKKHNHVLYNLLVENKIYR